MFGRIEFKGKIAKKTNIAKSYKRQEVAENHDHSRPEEIQYINRYSG